MTDTICAISSALGVGAISIIRLSGPEAISITSNVFMGKNLNEIESHTVSYGKIVENNEIIDEVLVTVMKAPKTFTKEDIVEINCHGGIATTNKILEVLLTAGCRIAEPGEFTKRAFLNGRIDLVEAEAIQDLINSKSNSARKLAISQVTGNISQVIKAARNNILEIMANIEVNIDFPEYEDAIEITNKILEDNLTTIEVDLKKILEEAENGKIIKDGINVALIGKPNVGKSSILNTFLEEEKAIVTNIAGTTRDIVEGQITLNNFLVNFTDTAGIRETTDLIEQIGVEKSKKALKAADLVIYVLANDEKITAEDLNNLNSINNDKLIVFVNKNDLETKIDKTIINKYNVIYGNTTEKEGIRALKDKIIELFNLSKIEVSDFTYLSNARQISLAKKALNYVQNALKDSRDQVPVDIIATDIKSAWDTLGEIIGETYKDELLDELFSKFCLGK